MFLRKQFVIVTLVVSAVFLLSYYEIPPIRQMMDWRATRTALAENEVSFSEYQIYDYTQGEEPQITIDFLKGKHFWNPQIAIWLEDSAGNYIETLLVTTSTARGLFYSGRLAQNFRESDETKSETNAPTRRVDALPYWSHKRGHVYPDGFYSPTPNEPLPDGITGATPTDNFYFKTEYEALTKLNSFKILVEVNVAFDENEYYSEYDFPDDSLYHGGTGLLGQPSVIYSAAIKKADAHNYYVLTMQGHGHHSGSTNELIPELETLTTAKYIVERVVVGIHESWYHQ